MLIKVSRVLVICETYIVLFIGMLTPILLISASFQLSTTFLTQTLFLIVMSSTLILSLIFGLSCNPDIELDEEETIIGGPFFYTKRAAFFKKLRQRQFVTKESLDVESIHNRSVIDSVFGVYKIYNKDGRGFKICRYFFCKREFNLIQKKVHDVLGVALT